MLVTMVVTAVIASSDPAANRWATAAARRTDLATWSSATLELFSSDATGLSGSVGSACPPGELTPTANSRPWSSFDVTIGDGLITCVAHLGINDLHSRSVRNNGGVESGSGRVERAVRYAG